MTTVVVPSMTTTCVRFQRGFVLAALLLLPSIAAAQERKGFWFDFEVGASSVDVSASGMNSPRDWGGTVGLGLGWALRPSLLAGMEFRFVSGETSALVDAGINVYNVMGAITFYPRATSGFFVKGAAGGSFVDLNVDAQGTTLTANVGKGLGVSGGVGYDVYLGRGFSLTPAVTVWYGRVGDVRFVGQTIFSDWTHNAVDLTIGVSFH
jgi:outer membrane protein with beta-barrel domain